MDRRGRGDAGGRVGRALIAAAVLLVAPGTARATGPQPASYDGATTLGSHRFGLSALVGFPFAGVDLSYGLTSRLDLRAGVQTIYGRMTQATLAGRFRLVDRGYAVAARLGAAVTVSRPDPTTLKMTMSRSFDVTPGIVASAALGSTTFFFETGVDVAFDLSPSVLPLSGPAPAFTVGAALPLHMGIEAPLGAHLGFLALIGLDVPLTTTPVDNVSQPLLAVGLDFTG